MLYQLTFFAIAYVLYVMFGGRLIALARRNWRNWRKGKNARIPRNLGRGFNKPFSGEPIPRDEKTDAELRSLLESTASEALFLCREYPPSHEERNLSYFGGLPTLPEEFDWPTFEPWSNSTPVSMHPLAQIDCSALPAFSDRESLPASGLLFFFAHTDLCGVGAPYAPRLETAAMARVLYYDAPTEGLRERPAPETLPLCYGGESPCFYDWRDCRGHDEATRYFWKWPIRAVAVRTYDDRHPTRPEAPVAGRYQELWEIAQREIYVRAFGDPVMSARWPEKSGPGLWFPDDAFPYSWNCVDTFARYLRKQLKDPFWREQITEIEDLNGRRVLFAGEEYCDKVLGELERLIGHADKAGRFAPVPEERRRVLRAWIQDLAAPDAITGECIAGRHLDKNLYQAFSKSVADCITHSAGTATLIPNSAIAVAHPQHASFRQGAFSGMVRHQIMGPPIVTQSDWREPDDVLLLQLDSDDGMNWLWSSDCGAFQFWIKRDDLAAKRFDRVRPHIEG